MNAIELLEALLRGPAGGQPASEAQRGGTPQATPHRSQQPAGGENRGAQILRDILSGRQPEQTPPPAARPQPTESHFPSDSESEYQKTDLKELLRAAKEREGAAASGHPVRTRPAAPGQDVPRAPAAAPAPARPREEDAAILIRAMINATRADGRMDQDEEQKLLSQIGQPSPEAIAYIRTEFQKPLDVREFAWSVPLGLEEKVYALSLSVLDVDQREESDYLNQLAHGLRLSPETCAQLHQQFGASVLG